MKIRAFFLAVLCLCLVCLSACGMPAASDTSEPETTSIPFTYTKQALPDGWNVLTDICTPTFLRAVYGEDNHAPTLSVSVQQYDDVSGANKAETLVYTIQEREKGSSEIGKQTIGGVDFFFLSIPSPIVPKALRYEFYGQTEPDADNNYLFYTIVLDPVADETQYASLQNVLDCIDFTKE